MPEVDRVLGNAEKLERAHYAPDFGLAGAERVRVNDIMAVREIRGWTPATPLPHAPAYVRGVINLRGAVLPIVDLAERLGLGAAAPTPRHVIIVA